jgi:hypothetical protein
MAIPARRRASAARISAISASSLENTPLAVWPRAIARSGKSGGVDYDVGLKRLA